MANVYTRIFVVFKGNGSSNNNLKFLTFCWLRRQNHTQDCIFTWKYKQQAISVVKTSRWFYSVLDRIYWTNQSFVSQFSLSVFVSSVFLWFAFFCFVYLLFGCFRVQLQVYNVYCARHCLYSVRFKWCK